MSEQQKFLALSNNQFEELDRVLSSGIPENTQKMLMGLSSADIAHLLESSPPKQRSLLWKLIPVEREGDVLYELGDEVKCFFIDQMDVAELINIIEKQDVDDIADLLQKLPHQITSSVLASMEQQHRKRVEEVLAYPKDTAGGLMNTDIVTVRENIIVGVALRYLRQQQSLPEPFDQLIIVDHCNCLRGTLSVGKLLAAQKHMLLSELMDEKPPSIPVSMKDAHVAQLFERQDLVSTPVTNDSGQVLGRITVDDVVDVIRDQAEHSVMRRAGLDDDEDTFAPLMRTARRRAVWLGINLMTAFIASAVIGMFEGTLDQVVALAILMPIVASMGGVAGSQTLTLVIRAMSLGQLGKSNTGWLLGREGMVGLLNGILWAAVVSSATVFWFGDSTISLVIGLSMVINLVVAVLAGAVLPLFLQSIRIDPTLAGNVILTTITDVVGLLSFLGLATLFLDV